MIFLCCETDERRDKLREHESLNGIDFVEVLDREAPEGSPRQRTLIVRLFKPVPSIPEKFDPKNVTILGGDRIKSVQIEWIAQASTVEADAGVTKVERDYFRKLPDADKTLLVRTNSDGDYSTYTLRLVTAAPDPRIPGSGNLDAPEGFDPVFSQVGFSFKVECQSDFDCLPQRLCLEEPVEEPDIDYLAKDYASFRRLMLDRMAQLTPAWRERSPADLGIALVELLAYVGDHLSYRQDAIAAEAYLGTARRRVSVRRHARLVDYAMHDGCNARAFVQIQVETSPEGVLLPARKTQLLTRVSGLPPCLPPASSPYYEAMRSDPTVFQTMDEALLFEPHNEMHFYTWSGRECCLPRGAVRATLEGHLPRLHRGDVLILEEIRSPITGRERDADPRQRHAVRLVEVKAFVTPAGDRQGTEEPLKDVLTGAPITEIRWHVEDALPFPLCVASDVKDPDHPDEADRPISVARGNIVLADHGRRIEDEALGDVPAPHLFQTPDEPADRCKRPERKPVPPRFRPILKHGPLTQAAPYHPESSAKAVMQSNARDAVPAIELFSEHEQERGDWEPKRDLLGSDGTGHHFVAEVEDDGTTRLRFGDDHRGMRPQSGTAFTANYRVGNGTAGNIGAEALYHVVTDQPGMRAVRNPLPAQGGVDPETIEEVRKSAPHAFRTQQRAVTPLDYAEVSKRHPQIQQAAATFRWTGSWHTVFLTIDRFHGLDVDQPFEDDIRRHVEPFRMVGYDLEVDAPRFVPLEIDVQVCVKRYYFRSDVKRALSELFSSGVLRDGRLGVFHPDNFSFGQPVYLSLLYAAAREVPGVESVTITKFQRQGVPDPKPLETGRIELGRLEIARLDNDRNFPDRGTIRFELGGGK